jgi:hypothetical protein
LVAIGGGLDRRDGVVMDNPDVLLSLAAASVLSGCVRDWTDLLA